MGSSPVPPSLVSAFSHNPFINRKSPHKPGSAHNIHVRGYKEEGTITTYFDMTVLNDLDRFHLVQDAIHRVGSLGSRGATLKAMMTDKLGEHKRYIVKHGVDMPDIRNWKWGSPA